MIKMCWCHLSSIYLTTISAVTGLLCVRILAIRKYKWNWMCFNELTIQQTASYQLMGLFFFMYFFLFLASKRIFFELIVPGDGHLEFAWCISLTSLQLSVSFLCCDRASAWLIFVPMHASRLLARQAASAKGGCHCWSSKGEVDNCERRSQMWMYWLFLKVFIF